MPKKILVIDDEEILTKSFAMLLEKKGYEAYTARNGQDAQALIEGEDIDLIICDIRMPGQNGIATIVAIKQAMEQQGKKGVPVIFVTGFADASLEGEAQKLKPLAYIFKPFDMQELLNIVIQGIGQSQRSEEP